MIVKALMDMVKAVILFFIGLFPTLPDLSHLVSHIQPFFDVLGSINSFVSVSLVVTCIGFLFFISHIELFWSVIMWVIRKIPGVS